MRIAIRTDTPQFSADIADVVRLFFTEPALVDPASEACDALLDHAFMPQGDAADCRVTWTDAQGTWMQETTGVPTQTGLLPKRLRKRAIKICCYDLLKQVTGKQPLWGSLTGIRPTRLYYEQLAEGYTPQEAQRRLVSTFDLSPQKAALLGEVVAGQQGLMNTDDRAVDIYVGIPFCTTRCTYCSFASGEIGNGRQVAPYLVALARELAATRRIVLDANLAVRALYVGGGTPTALTSTQLEGVLRALGEAFPGAEEWTVEAGRPDTLDPEKLAMLRDYPVTRISINPQTMQDQTLRRIGRAHTAADTVRAYDMARREGFDHINMDLIAALPGEDEADFADTLAQAAVLAPESLTVHTLALKRASKLRDTAYTPCDAHSAQAMVDAAHDAAVRMGLAPYYLYRQKYMAGNLENVGYAMPGLACRYNIDMMEETTSILAVGAGAISKRVFGHEARIERAPNVSDIDHYLERVDEMIARKRALWGFLPGD